MKSKRSLAFLLALLMLCTLLSACTETPVPKYGPAATEAEAPVIARTGRH